jgi:hypothetical protein
MIITFLTIGVLELVFACARKGFHRFSRFLPSGGFVSRMAVFVTLNRSGRSDPDSDLAARRMRRDSGLFSRINLITTENAFGTSQTGTMCISLSSGAMELIFFSRADRTLTDRVTTAWDEPRLEKATPVCRNNCNINGYRVWGI